ncbi:MAG: hypothetical protein LBV74_06580 [Tannerella sp.]|jgi:hypothetical protein|nr:hypothetical protein [Tannerella sp.]
MVHNSYDKVVPNDNIPSYYLLFYNSDYSAKQQQFLMSDRAIEYFPLITTDNASRTYIAANYGKSAYWDTGTAIANSNHLDNYLGSGNNFETASQINKVVLTRMNPDYTIKWMFQIGREQTTSDQTQVIATDMKTIGNYTYLVGYFMGNDVNFNGILLTNTDGGYPNWNWNFDVFYAVFDNETGVCAYAVGRHRGRRRFRPLPVLRCKPGDHRRDLPESRIPVRPVGTTVPVDNKQFHGTGLCYALFHRIRFTTHCLPVQLWGCTGKLWSSCSSYL